MNINGGMENFKYSVLGSLLNWTIFGVIYNVNWTDDIFFLVSKQKNRTLNLHDDIKCLVFISYVLVIVFMDGNLLQNTQLSFSKKVMVKT